MVGGGIFRWMWNYARNVAILVNLGHKDVALDQCFDRLVLGRNLDFDRLDERCTLKLLNLARHGC